MYRDYYDSPIGTIEIRANGRGITALDFYENTERREPAVPNPILEKAKSQLAEYFSGERQAFDLKIEMQGTEFQKSVWRKLLDIPYGQTCSYFDIARKTGNPKAVRAVGAANGKNPIALIVPCHRVIGSDGRLTGYAGGLDRKAWLLQHEAATGFRLS